MPRKEIVDKAKQDLAQGKSPSTAAGEFVREEMDHIRQGKHGARSTKQAIAIGLSEARRAGVPLKPPRRGRVSSRTQRSAELAYEEGQGRRQPRAPSRKRGRAAERALRARRARRCLTASAGEPGARRGQAAQRRRPVARREAGRAHQGPARPL